MSSGTVRVDDAPLTTDGSSDAGLGVVSADYFKTIGARVIARRDFTTADRLDAPPSAIVNAAFARAFLRGADPVGHQIQLGGLTPARWTIVGEVKDIPQIGWDVVYGTVAPTGTATVAVLDTGLDARHPDLAGRVISGVSILDGSDGTTDPSGHGTWLAGIVAANTGSLEGIAGVGYAGVRVLPVTVLDANGIGRDSDIIAGVVWAADRGADVILMAFSATGFSSHLQDALDYAWSKGAVLVAAAGNAASSDPTFPAGHRGVMGVAATDPNDRLAPFSNEGQSVFIAAPGTDIQTTDVADAYIVVSGTSTAAAHVAGVAGFMRAVDPTLSNGVIVGRLARTADPAGAQSQTGNGRLNMARALEDTSAEEVRPAGAAWVRGIVCATWQC